MVLSVVLGCGTLQASPATIPLPPEVPGPPSDDNSPREALRLDLFKDAPKTAACKTIRTDPRGRIPNGDPGLEKTLQELLQALQAKNDKALQPLFHPRLNVGLAALQDTFAKLAFTYGPPITFSVYRLWALNTVSGLSGGLDCADDLLTIYPQYGYPLQFGLWLQVMGDKEIGRIYVALVPTLGRWVIGAFRTHQWTHAAQDHTQWAEAGRKAAQSGHNAAAFIKFDTAAKLADAGPFLDLAVQAGLNNQRDAVMSRPVWDEAMRKVLKGFDVVHTATILVLDGDGVLVRIREPKELSLEDMTSRCKSVAQAFVGQGWRPLLTGVRCSFVLPTEDAKKDGAMGSLYLALADETAKAPK